ncbi:MAG: phosphohistidine phosphatase [Microbacterium sp. SCN 70-200]|uniref:SixA phosphatase family protein n=1 Tax=unclassified Microbacterium TaxID=2609290 RepID=UPI00086BFD4A|nr:MULTISPECIES: histidine phosphatase family protein [unclassified Microbacterium]MBN9213466.1 histidine phosphatase family protein [Microbacterium sp.]ODT41710.1 MAG: phosphohistidine phosphatase [Microbacterium sp. SCN 70-200]OJV85098.1 MAG: phosphohistidine phosphatase [Microbacterium sp. 70-16]
MTTLVLVRHAKSDWGNPGLDDHDRPLNDRGMRDAPVLAARLADTGLQLGALLSSTALRARTTAGFFAAALGVEAELDEELYGAPASTLLRTAAARGVDAVMVVAHDPGMTVLADRLSGGGIGHMPTCAVATFRWDTPDWDVATATDPDAWEFDRPGR